MFEKTIYQRESFHSPRIRHYGLISLYALPVEDASSARI